MTIAFTGAIFDLDGVIVNTAKYHYKAWKLLAEELGFLFTEQDNERLKGVDRIRSLEILLEIGNVNATEKEKLLMASKKNCWYIESLQTLNQYELLPGSMDYLLKLRNNDIKIALGSASKNARMILDKLQITELFDAIIDGTCVIKAKPDPEVFLKASKAIDLSPAQCVVFEDSQAGIEAASAAGCRSIGIGSPLILSGASYYIDNLSKML